MRFRPCTGRRSHSRGCESLTHPFDFVSGPTLSRCKRDGHTEQLRLTARRRSRCNGFQLDRLKSAWNPRVCGAADSDRDRSPGMSRRDHLSRIASESGDAQEAASMRSRTSTATETAVCALVSFDANDTTSTEL